MKCDTEPVVLRGDSSSVFPNQATEVEQPGTWNMQVIKSELSNKATDSDMEHLDSWIGEGTKSRSSNCYASRSDHVDHTYATTPDRYNTHIVKSELTDTCTDQQPIHYVEKHVSSLHGERCVQDINMAEHNITNAQIKTHSRPHCHKSFNCVIQCDKRFSYSSQLMEHMMTPGIKPYSCIQCHKIYRYSTQLNEHMRTHTGDKPYSCIQCHKRYIYSTQLKEHMRTHTGEKPYSCIQCPKRYIYSSQLKEHMRTHTGEKPYACVQCGKRFTRATILKEHMRIHTGQKPYACYQCDKRFYNATKLKVHTRAHTGEKPYSCVHCDKIFSYSNGLRLHMRTHTVKTRK